MLVFEQALPPLASGNSDDGGSGLIEAIEDTPNSVAQSRVQKSPSINAEQIGTGVFKGHTLAAMVNARGDL